MFGAKNPWDHCSGSFRCGGLVVGLLMEVESAGVSEPQIHNLIFNGNGHAIYQEGARGRVTYFTGELLSVENLISHLEPQFLGDVSSLLKIASVGLTEPASKE